MLGPSLPIKKILEYPPPPPPLAIDVVLLEEKIVSNSPKLAGNAGEELFHPHRYCL